MIKYRKKWRRYSDAQAQQEYHEARVTFYYEMKKAKSNCWNNFLENASEKDIIFKIFQYTKQNRVEKLSIIQYQSENREVNAMSFSKLFLSNHQNQLSQVEQVIKSQISEHDQKSQKMK